MHSSPSLSLDDDEMFPDESQGPSTPTHPSFPVPSSELSPPNSQGPSLHPNYAATDSDVLATFATPSTLNENGKRVLGGGGLGVGGGNGVVGGGARGGGISKFAAQGKGEHVHKATGYAWDRVEDEPGYIWMNKRAMEEGHRAWDVIVDKGSMIKSEFGL
jgi:hypothetical protein